MLGKDFFVFWQIGRALLQGAAPYSSPETLYPPAMLFFFVPLALIPFQYAFGLWTGINGLLFYRAVKSLTSEKTLGWFFFTPVLFILLTGQIDIIFLWGSTFLKQDKRWLKIIVAVLMTLKPQIAFIVLPWFLFQWIKEESQSFLLWLLGCFLLHGFPLLIDPLIYQKWITATRTYSESRMLLSPGIFSLTNFQIPVWLISIISVVVVIIGLWKNQKISKAAQILALPMGIWYENVFLIGCVSWKIMVLLSWLVFLLAYLTKSSVPFTLIPLVAFGFLFNEG
jgi:hypothetical protein